MKTFIQHIQTLKEGRDAPLYHGIKHIDIAVMLLKSGVIEPATTHQSKFLKSANDVVKGISLTRSYVFAKKWSALKESSNNRTVIEFDQSKLTNTFKIVPFNYWPQNQRQFSDNEFEEFVILNRNIEIAKYATRIYADLKVFERLFFDVTGRNSIDITECMSFCHKYLGVSVGPIK